MSEITIRDIGPCDCCGAGGCVCCDHVAVVTSGVWQEWDIEFGEFNMFSSCGDGCEAYSLTTVRVTKVTGQCVWRSTDGLVRVFFPSDALAFLIWGALPATYGFCVGLYASSGADNQNPYAYGGAEWLTASADELWCRDSANTNPILSANLLDGDQGIRYAPPPGTTCCISDGGYTLTPVAGTWMACP